VPVARGTGDVALHWEEHGQPDGEPVVLVMGLAGSARPWWRLLPALEDRYRVVALDNRGTGRSTPVAGALTMDDLARDVLTVMDDAGLDDAHVVGASMGGMVAQHLGLDHRDRVRSLALGCTTPRGGGGLPPWRIVGATVLRPVLGPRRALDFVAPTLYARETRERHRDRIEEDLAVRLEDATSTATVRAQAAAIGGTTCARGWVSWPASRSPSSTATRTRWSRSGAASSWPTGSPARGSCRSRGRPTSC
jgi:3-oxoadipate enol-lactonase